MNSKELQERINKSFGYPLLLNLKNNKNIKIGISSGSLNLNMALSGNPFVGYTFGRIVEIYGNEGTGKTTLALTAIRESQKWATNHKTEFPSVYIDMEHSLDVDYAESLGCDLTKLSISQPSYGEEAIKLAEECIKEGYRLVVIDSVASLIPLAELEGDISDAHIGLQARLMSSSLRRLIGLLRKKEAILIFTNQIRMKIGVLFGNPETTPGGKALKFFSSYRLELTSPRSGAKKEKTLSNFGVEDSLEVGKMVNVKIVKNKVFPPFRKASIFLRYGIGIDKIEDILMYLELNNYLVNGFNIPSKNKTYKKTGLKKLLKDETIQREVLDIVRNDYNKRVKL